MVTVQHCQNDTSLQTLNPCMNGGECNELDGDFNCTCPTGFIGDLCQYRQCIRLTSWQHVQQLPAVVVEQGSSSSSASLYFRVTAKGVIPFVTSVSGHPRKKGEGRKGMGWREEKGKRKGRGTLPDFYLD